MLKVHPQSAIPRLKANSKWQDYRVPVYEDVKSTTTWCFIIHILECQGLGSTTPDEKPFCQGSWRSRAVQGRMHPLLFFSSCNCSRAMMWVQHDSARVRSNELRPRKEKVKIELGAHIASHQNQDLNLSGRKSMPSSCAQFNSRAILTRQDQRIQRPPCPTMQFLTGLCVCPFRHSICGKSEPRRKR